MTVLNRFYWNLYKSSQIGKKTITQFAALENGELAIIEKIKLLKKFDPEFFMNIEFEEAVSYFEVSTGDFKNLLDIVSVEEYNKWLREIIEKDEDYVLDRVVPISFLLFESCSEYFIPYMFLYRYKYLQQVVDNLNLDIEVTPGPSDKRKRSKFYLDICDAIRKYRLENNLTPAEMCALIYDMERRSYDAEFPTDVTPYPRVWWIVGAKSEKESKSSTMFWQANPEIRKGDILVFYEKGDTFKKSNRSAITGIWTALTDGDVDPFFHFYRYVFLANEISCKPIPYKVIKNDPLTSTIKGVSAHFQNYSGREIPASDYEQVLKLIKQEDPSFDETSLPKRYSASINFGTPYDQRGNMKPEKWVEENFIVPLLKKMGWNRMNIDYRRQVYLQLGRKKDDEYKAQAGKTDFSIFPFGENNRCADILIEAKGPGEMDGAKLKEAFNQGESYASRQYAELLGLCDDKHLMLYIKSKDGNFRFTKTPFKCYEWKTLFEENSPEYTELYNLFVKYQRHKPRR